ncbi:hypothetical protein Tco_1359898 [Tanacetum coccineum]
MKSMSLIRAPFWMFTATPFLCLIRMSRNYTLDEDTYPTFLHDDETGEMDLLTFIHVADPTKVKVGEQERTKEEARLIDSTVGRVVPLLPIAPDRVNSELEASVEKLFDESGGADQGDYVVGGGQEIKAEIVLGVRFVDEDNVVAEKPKRPRKKRQAATDVSGFSHPPKKLREDHGKTFKWGCLAVAAYPLSPLLFLPLPGMRDSSHHSSTNASGAEGDSLIRSAVVPPVMTEEDITGSSHLPRKELSMGSREVDYESLHERFRDMDYKELFTEFSVGTARQVNKMALEDERKSLSGEGAGSHS